MVPGASDGRYTLQDELARGGMGRIWVANDARLDRKVAIKELLDGQRSRFERELALTSRLDHPSIVSVQDGGTWEDGKPYYVMKLVHGESLDRAIDRAHSTAARVALLPNGLAVVDALAYAHAQGIVHRDLKPENILVGDFGETVVIDWGLAKDLRATTPELVDGPYRDLVKDGETLGGEVLGTPAYMAPEQAMGDAVDERADVYALGAVLYHMLSGTRPYRGATSEDVLAAVIAGPPPALTGVPLDLATIVTKAMARDPEDRYANAGDLAIDLKRFQSGQLVIAHHYTTGQLLARWSKRHRGAVAVGSLAILALAGFAVFSFARIVRAEHDAQAARALAETHREVAEARRVAAEGLVTFMLGDLRDILEPVGKLVLLEEPAKKALAYFDTRPGHEALALEERALRAVALRNLALALRGKGELAGAETQMRAALAERAALVDEGGRGHGSLDAALHADLGDMLVFRGDAKGALAEYTASVTMFANLHDDGARVAEETLHDKLGDTLQQLNDLSGAAKEYGFAEALVTSRTHAHPDDVAARQALVAASQGVAGVMQAQGNLVGALAKLQSSDAELATFAAAHPGDMETQRMRAISLHRVGLVQLGMKDGTGAIASWRASAAISARLVASDPDNAGWQDEHALTYGRLASALRDAGDSEGAVAAYRQAIAILHGLSVKDPTNHFAKRDEIQVVVGLADLLTEQKRWKLATDQASLGVAMAEAQWQRDPTNHTNGRALTAAYATLGTAALGQKIDAREIMGKALDLARSLAASDKDDRLQIDLEEALVDLADARCASGGDARALYTEAAALVSAHAVDDDWRQLATELHARAVACKK